MCQCLPCDCIWCNCFETCCLGISCHLLCCSVWCCKPEPIQSFDYNCIACCQRSGLGSATCLGLALVCCVPEWLAKYSKKKASLKASTID